MRQFMTRPVIIIATAVFCTVLWGTAYPAVKIGYALFAIAPMDQGGKLLFAGVRFALAGVMTLLVSWMLQKKLMLPNREHWRGIMLLGFVQTMCQYIFFYLGLSNTTGVKSSILYATSTFVAVILAHILFKDDKMTLQKMAGCLIGFTGVVLITFDPGDLGSGFTWAGEGFILLSTISSGIGSIISRQVTQGQDPILITGYQLTIGGFLLILLGMANHGTFGAVSISGCLLLLYMAFLSAAAFTLWTLLLKYNTVSKITIFNFLIPVFGTLFSVMFLGESIFNLKSLLALLLACLGIYLVNAAPFKRQSSKTTETIVQ